MTAGAGATGAGATVPGPRSDGTSPGVPPIRVLFVCTHNSARSLMAEAVLRRRGGDDFEVASAGTEPSHPHPLTLRVLAETGFDTVGIRSRSVDDVAGERFDYVVTVCDRARQSCPVFSGGVARLHWGYDDPSEVTGSEEERLAAFRAVLTALGERVGLFMPIALKARAEALGQAVPAS